MNNLSSNIDMFYCFIKYWPSRARGEHPLFTGKALCKQQCPKKLTSSAVYRDHLLHTGVKVLLRVLAEATEFVAYFHLPV